MMSGSPPTERKARTGLFTPPTRICSASAKTSRERRRPCWGEGVELIEGPSCQRLFEPAGGVFRMIRQDKVRAGALNTGEYLENHSFFVEPAIFRGGFHHGILATHVVGGYWNAEFVFDPANYVEIRQRRFDHDHVRAFFKIECDLF